MKCLRFILFDGSIVEDKIPEIPGILIKAKFYFFIENFLIFTQNLIKFYLNQTLIYLDRGLHLIDLNFHAANIFLL